MVEYRPKITSKPFMTYFFIQKPTEKVQAEEKDDDEKELYSDEEEIVEEEEEDEEEPPKLTPQKTPQAPQKEEESETEEVPEDVEIIDDEQIDEEIEEEEVDEDEEEISDVDDSELLNRLEAKYGRLPEPARFGKNSKHSLQCALSYRTGHEFLTSMVNQLNPLIFLLA